MLCVKRDLTQRTVNFCVQFFQTSYFQKNNIKIARKNVSVVD